MQRIEQNGQVYYQFERLQGHGELRHGIFSRKGGVSAAPFESLNVGSTVGDEQANVLENRERLAQAMGVRDEQVHGGAQAG
ncbi:MAG: laccase domain-containing protein [Chloroflexota bacterium]